MADLTITDLDQTEVEAAEEFLREFLQDEYPSMDLTKGRVLRDLLIRPAAIFHVLNQDNMDTLRRSMSLQAIEEDPALADDAMVAGVLSNYLVEREVGTKAEGWITIIISQNVTVAVPLDTKFSANNHDFYPKLPYVAVLSGTEATENDRPIAARTDGTYSFTIKIVADIEGADQRLTTNTRMTVDPEPPYFIDASVAADFTGGSSTETNTELMARFREGISAKVLSGRTQINALLREQVPGIEATSLIGFGDPEMIRDRHNIFNISHGGKSDFYVQTQDRPTVTVLTKTATLISKDGRKWQFSVDRDDVPGFYTVKSINPAGSSVPASYEKTSEVRSLDLSGAGFIPDVDNLTEGAYSRYQTAVVQFIDTDTVTTDLIENVSTADYSVEILGMPYIKTLQDYVIDRDNRNPCADYLVRAPIPCLTGIGIKIRRKTDATAPSEAGIKSAVANTVNSIGFELGQLPASLVIDAAQDALPSGSIVETPIDMYGYLYKPSQSEVLLLRSSNALEVPNLPEEGVTSRTTLFYVDVDDITVDVVSVSVLDV